MRHSLQFRTKLSALLSAFIILLLVGQSFGQSQVKRYTTQTFTGSWSSIEGTGTKTSAYGDDAYTTISLPFNFNYDSVSYSAGYAWWVTCNGASGPTQNSYGSYSDQVGVSLPNMIAIFQADLSSNINSSTDGGIYWQVTGSSPNRVFTIEWVRFSAYSWTSYSSYANSFQEKFYEGSNIIEFIYQNKGYSSGNTVTKGVGLNGATPASNYNKYGTSPSTPTTDIRWKPAAPPVFPQLSVQPHLIDFGFVAAGATVTQNVTVRNVGASGVLHFLGQSITGPFSYVGTRFDNTLGNMDSIPLGGSRNVTVSYTANTSGSVSGLLSFVTDANPNDSATQTVQLRATVIAPEMKITTTDLFKKVKARFGDTVRQSFLVQSTGTGPLTITGATLSGDYPGEYKILRVPTQISSGTSDTVTIAYIPTIEGSRPATLTITSNGLLNKTATIGLYGIGLLPRIVVTPTPLTFDSVNVGQSLCKPITIWNAGTDTLAIKGNYFLSADPDFTFTPLTGTDTLIAPDRTRQIQVCFTPRKNGSRLAKLRLLTNIPLTSPYDGTRRDTSSIIVDITGYGVPAANLTVGGNTGLDSVIVDQEKCKTDTVYNMGSADVTVTSVTITGTDAGNFTISNAPTIIRAGSFAVFTLCEKPTSRGLHSDAVVVVTGTFSGKPVTLNVPIGVYGLNACANADQTTLFGTSKVLAGTTGTADVVITNCGEVPATYSAALSATTAGTYTIQGATTSGVVAPGATATFTVKFAPTDRTAQAGMLIVSGASGDGIAPINVTLAGVGYGATITGTATVPTTAVGQSNPFEVILTNNGNIDWDGGTPSATAGYSVESGPGIIAANGGTGTLKLKFSPTTEGLVTGTVTFPTSTPTESPVFTLPLSGTATSTSGVKTIAQADGFSLGQNYPNPFNPTTSVDFTMPKDGMVKLTIVDVNGKTVKTAFEGKLTAGSHTVTIDASQLTSGTYFYELASGNTRLVRSMVLSK